MSVQDLHSDCQPHDQENRQNVDADQVLMEVRRNHRALELSLYRRDVSEIVAAALVTCVFGGFAVQMRDWTLFLCSAGGLFVGLFFVVDRWIQYRRRPIFDDSLQSCIQASLVQVNHQIWLLRNILWWYLLPLVPGLVVFLGSLSWKMLAAGVIEQFVIAAVGLFCALVFWWVYRLNQQAVKNSFEPRREELEALLASLKQ